MKYVDNNDILSRHLNMNTTRTRTENDSEEQTAWLEIVRRQVGSLRYGVVQIVVHDSKITQIEKTERVRLDKSQVQTI